jgi:hypothetical protein
MMRDYTAVRDELRQSTSPERRLPSPAQTGYFGRLYACSPPVRLIYSWPPSVLPQFCSLLSAPRPEEAVH